MSKIIKLTPLNARLIFDKFLAEDSWEFKDVREMGGLTLTTGAKLYFSHTSGYFVSGYHYAGDDLKPFEKYAKVV